MVTRVGGSCKDHSETLKFAIRLSLIEREAERDVLAPATKQDILNLLQELRQKSNADLDLIRTEVQAVTAQTQASEEDITDIRHEDLTRNTLQSRRSFSAVTNQLRDAGADYLWSLPRALMVIKNGTTLRLTTPAESPTFFRAPSTSQAWDPERITPFIPGAKKLLWNLVRSKRCHEQDQVLSDKFPANTFLQVIVLPVHLKCSLGLHR
ncbi:Hypothetical predicted protein [Pelobates cultripes]|uniref:Uncharacterized protein n=1 Tax=Pelobates cultripes TaxID=61616 RepID=A0AAD1WES8_PELCU|nr:Hypothetical predicted protein [Pelobates cultripes]